MKLKEQLHLLYEGIIAKNFHKLYYGSKHRTWKNTYWLGVPCFKCPLDLWIYQEIAFEVKPDVIIETGTGDGGSALFLAFLCEQIGCGTVISIDIKKRTDLPEHSRITYLFGSSVSQQIVQEVTRLTADKNTVLIMLDSSHRKEHVLKELRVYNRFVTAGSYLIVEDSNLNGHPVKASFGPGPMEAINEFLKENQNFIVDVSREKFYLTFSPNGYLKRIR